MFSKIYFDYGLSKKEITDEDIIKAFSLSKNSARHIQTLVNARNNEMNYKHGNNFCEYCDVDKENPLNLSTFETFCDDFETYKENHQIFFYYKSKVENPMTTDHINPKGLGGSLTDPFNMAVCCQSCNKLKGSKTFSKFVEAVKNNPKYKRFIETYNNSIKFTMALEFKPKPIDYVKSNFVEPDFIDIDEEQRISYFTIDPKVGISALHWVQSNPLLVNNEKCYVFLNTKIRSLRKYKTKQLLQLKEILDDDYKCKRYLELLEQRFDISNYDVVLLKEYVNKTLQKRNKTVEPEEMIDVELDYSENGYFVRYNGELEPFELMSRERVLALLKTIKHCLRTNITSYIPPSIRVKNLDTQALYNRLEQQKEKILNN